MSIAAGPNVVSNGLVLEYDMSNTKRSWKGAPTVNQFAIPDPYNAAGDVGFQVNGTGVFQRVTTGSFGGYDITSDDIVYKYVLGAPGCHYHGNDVTIQAGQWATWSFDYYVDPSITGYPQTNYLANFEGVLGGSIGDPTPSIIGVWKSLTFAGYAGSTGVCRMLLYPGACGDRLATGGFVLFKNPQVSFDTPGNLPLPFVAGTRSTSQSLLDLTQNNTLTATSLTYASDNTFSFNGSSNYITSLYNPIINSATTFTLDFWATLTNPATDMMIFSTSNYPAGNGWHLQTYQSKLILQVYPSGTYTFSTQTLPTNTVFCGTLVYNSGAITYYHNGAPAGTASYTFNPSSIGATIGAWINSGAPQYFAAGKIYSTKFYNRALSAVEVAQNFNALRGRYGI